MAGSRVPDGCPLTWGQFEVLQRVCDGLTYDQVALERGKATSTIRSTLHEACKRLGATGTKQAMSIMGRSGWLGWQPADPVEEPTPLAVEHPFLAAYLQEFERSGWPNEPDVRSALGMRLALAGHRNTLTSSRRTPR